MEHPNHQIDSAELSVYLKPVPPVLTDRFALRVSLCFMVSLHYTRPIFCRITDPLTGLLFIQGNFSDKYFVQELLAYCYDADDFTLECHSDQRLYVVKFSKSVGENCLLK